VKFSHPVQISTLTRAFPELIIKGNVEHVEGAAIVPFAEAHDLVFADTDQWLTRAFKCKAALIITTRTLASRVESERGHNKTLLLHDDPLTIFLGILKLAGVESVPDVSEKCQDLGRFAECRISPDAWISSDAVIGKGSIIGPHVYVGPRVVIGENCVLQAGSKLLWNVTLDSDVRVQSNCVIGGDPFFFHTDTTSGPRALPRSGGVRIGASVSIGCGTCIDRGVLEDTVIGQRTVIDNLVQIGHGTRIGNDVIVAAHAAIAGHVRIGDRVRIMGKVGIVPNVSIASDVTVLGSAVVSRTIPRQGIYAGIRARPFNVETRRQSVLVALESIAGELNQIFAPDKADTNNVLKGLIESQFGVPREEIHRASTFVDDFGIDSLDMAELKIGVESKFDIVFPDDIETKLHTFQDLIIEVARLQTNKPS